MSAPVYLVRHGQSEWNVLRLTQGQTPHPRLTDLGRRQASAAAGLVAADLAALDLVATRLVSSDLLRASETAVVIGDRLGLVPEHDERLREQHLGSLQGRGYDETWAVAEQHDWSDPSLPVAGGESLLDVSTRMAAVLDALSDPGGGRVTVVVSHGDALRAAVAHLSGVAPHEAPWIEVPNGAVARAVPRAGGSGAEITWLGV